MKKRKVVIPIIIVLIIAAAIVAVVINVRKKADSDDTKVYVESVAQITQRQGILVKTATWVLWNHRRPRRSKRIQIKL